MRKRLKSYIIRRGSRHTNPKYHLPKSDNIIKINREPWRGWKTLKNGQSRRGKRIQQDETRFDHYTGQGTNKKTGLRITKGWVYRQGATSFTTTTGTSTAGKNHIESQPHSRRSGENEKSAWCSVFKPSGRYKREAIDISWAIAKAPWEKAMDQ